MSWEIIDEHRKRARQISFKILVWGSSVEDINGYNLRQAIKAHLVNNGHSAKFSEELIKEGAIAAAPDPVIDEIFHADTANLIIVLYGSRGTQTEVDRILEYEQFARKSVIVIDESVWACIMQSLSCVKWQSFGAKILRLPDNSLNAISVCGKLDQLIEELQFAEYIRKLKLRFLRNE